MGHLIVGRGESGEGYYPAFAASVQKYLCERGIGTQDIRRSTFANGMPLLLADQSPHAALLLWLNGDNYKATLDELFFAHVLRQNLDRGGPSAKKLTVALPFKDSRQDLKSRKPIPDGKPHEQAIVQSQGSFTEATAQFIGHVTRADGLLTIDNHSRHALDQLKRAGVDPTNLTAARLFADQIRLRGLVNDQTVAMTTDFGDLARTYLVSGYLKIPLAIVQKFSIAKDGGTRRSVEQKLLWGDVKGKRVIIIDDMISSAGSVLASIKLALSLGAEEVIFCATHPVFVAGYYTALQEALANPKVKLIMVGNTLPLGRRINDDADVPYLGPPERRKFVEVLDLTEFFAWALYTVLITPTYKEAKQILKPHILKLEDPYRLYTKITGDQPDLPIDKGVYVGGGEIEFFED